MARPLTVGYFASVFFGAAGLAVEAVLSLMCIALTRASPSRMPLARSHSATCGVMLTNCRRRGISNKSSLRKVFTGFQSCAREIVSDNDKV